MTATASRALLLTDMVNIAGQWHTLSLTVMANIAGHISLTDFYRSMGNVEDAKTENDCSYFTEVRNRSLRRLKQRMDATNPLKAKYSASQLPGDAVDRAADASKRQVGIFL